MKGPYDFIGDVHGYAETLERLLQKMDYRFIDGCWQHPERTAVFVGDLIDRGPENLRTVQLVKAMADNKKALVVMGNHEYNALCFHTSYGHRGYLRPHNHRTVSQHKDVLDEIEEEGKANQELWQTYLEWFRRLPLFLELEGCRIVHACWDPHCVEYIRSHVVRDDSGRLTDRFLADSSWYGSQAYKAIETLLKGKEIPLPFFHRGIRDRDNNLRKRVRLRWWLPVDRLEDIKTYDQVARVDHQIREKLTGLKLPGRVRKRIIHSIKELDGIPTFIGHYWFSGEPRLLADTVVSLDYSVARGGPLVAYRFDGEKKLNTKHFIYASDRSQVSTPD